MNTHVSGKITTIIGEKSSMVNFIKNLLYGIIIGISNIVPGVSGGTIAVILNVYNRLISSISNFSESPKKSVKFLVPLLLGAGLGILFFSRIISYALYKFPVATNFFFMGLIVGSVPMLYKKSVKPNFNFALLVAFLVGLAVMITSVAMMQQGENVHVMVNITLVSFFKIFLVSILASAAMLIPGISGSFIMLLFGIYTTVLRAISDLNVPILIPVALGIIVGIIGGAKVIGKLFAAFPQICYAAITGLVIGSLFAIYPGLNMNLEGLCAIIVFAIGARLVYWFSSEKRESIGIKHKKIT